MKRELDNKYIVGMKNKDEEATKIVYDFYKNHILFFVSSLVKNRDDAEDIVQDVFVKVIQKVDTLENLNSFHSWVFTIAYNTSMTHLKKKGKTILLSDEDGLQDLLESKQGKKNYSDLDKDAVIKAIKSSIEELPDRFSIVAQLSFFDNLSVREISQVLEIPEGTVKTRLLKVRKKIQPFLKKKGILPTTFFSFGGLPLVVRAYTEMMNTTLAIESVGASTVAVGGSLLASSLVKVTLVSSIAGIGAFATYTMTKPNLLEIKEIVYEQEPTNQSVEVEIELTSAASIEDVKVDSDNKSMEVTGDGNLYYFVADENATYHINVEGSKQDITISNIDKNNPNLDNVTYKEGIMSLELSDETSKIDYENSYVLYQENRYAINSKQQVKGDFKGKITLFIADTVGNASVYEIDVII